MTRSKLPYFFLVFAAVLALTALILLILRPGLDRPPAGKPSVKKTNSPSAIPGLEKPGTGEKDPDPNPGSTPAELGLGVASVNPNELVNRIAKALQDGDFATASKLIGKQALDDVTLQRLKEIAAMPVRLRQPDGVREVGELELNARARWSLELDGKEPGRDRIFLDLRREDGKWMVERLTLPPAENEPVPKAVLADSLGVADAFLQAVLKQDFEFARAFVDPARVSDAKIAGLCILFEEGQYTMRASKPLRAMFQREDTVGYIANVQTMDASQIAQFALSLRQPPAPANWLVTEINLDELLADYARRVAGGDIYYSPLVKNPAGGDTIALYFEFDEAEVNPRTRRQLEIVSLILRSDPGKKLTISGHTDALGTQEYNNQLSSRRAEVVRDFLAKSGVDPVQIVTIGKGDSQPRRPNVTETGEDDPGGRRANRRTEIYLDF